MSHILITGGTGTLGQQLVRQLCYQGFDIGIITTRKNVDLPSGAKIFTGDLTRRESVSNAVREATIIIHCASNPQDARRVDVEGTRNLLASADSGTLQHIVYLSIAGVDQSPYPYYRAKFEAENMIQDSGLPWSVLRATQFHDFVLYRLIEPADRRDGSSLKVPTELRFQSVDVKDVALRLQDMATGKPLRHTVTIGGPEILTLEQMARVYLTAQGRNEDIQPANSGRYFDIFQSGLNVNPQWSEGRISWKDFLKNTLLPQAH